MLSKVTSFVVSSERQTRHEDSGPNRVFKQSFRYRESSSSSSADEEQYDRQKEWEQKILQKNRQRKQWLLDNKEIKIET